MLIIKDREDIIVAKKKMTHDMSRLLLLMADDRSISVHIC